MRASDQYGRRCGGALSLLGGLWILMAGCATGSPGQRWPDPMLSRTVSVDGRQWHVLDSAPQGREQTLLCLHGWAGTACDFLPLIETLPAEVRIVAIDFPGSGHSPPAPDGNYSVEAYARVVESVAAALALDRVVVVAHSLGARAAIRFVERREASLVGGVVLIAPHVFAGQAGRGLAGMARHRRLVGLGLRLNNRAILRMGLRRRVFHDADRIDPRVAACAIESQLSPDGRRALAEVTVAQLGAGSSTELAGLTVPTLILWGEDDRVLDPSWAAAVHSELVRSRLVSVPACGHQPMVEQVERTAGEVMAFLRGLRR